MRLTSLLCLLLAAACSAACSSSSGPGGSSAGGAGTDGGAGSPAASCQDDEQTVKITGTSVKSGQYTYTKNAHVDGLIENKGETFALVETPQTDGSMRLGFRQLGVDKAEKQIITLPDAAGSDGTKALASAVPVVVGDRLCAVYVQYNQTLRMACDDGSSEDSGVDDVSTDHALLPVVEKDGTLRVFTQTYASYTEIARSPDGKWAEHEKYESSISYPTDAVVVKGHAVVCYVNSGGSVLVDGLTPPQDSGVPGLELPGEPFATKIEATTCRLAVDGAKVHLLVGTTYFDPTMATHEISGLSTGVGPMFVLKGEPYVVVNGGKTSEAISLTGGESLTLGPDSVVEAQVIDGALVTASEKLGSSATYEPETTIQLTTTCP